MDNNAFIFWNGPTPSLLFNETSKITFKGANVCNIRKDIDIQDLWAYIQTYYRSLTPETLCKNICTLKVKDIKNLKRGEGYPLVVAKNEGGEYKKPTTHAAIPFNYENIKEQNGFNKLNAGRFLACLNLAGCYSSRYLPTDVFEAGRFFKENFSGNEKEVLERYCDFHSLNIDEFLTYYKNICETQRNKCERSPPVYKKKISTIDVLVGTFLHLTK